MLRCGEIVGGDKDHTSAHEHSKRSNYRGLLPRYRKGTGRVAMVRNWGVPPLKLSFKNHFMTELTQWLKKGAHLCKNHPK
jgi:hypothetical protein